MVQCTELYCTTVLYCGTVQCTILHYTVHMHKVQCTVAISGINYAECGLGSSPGGVESSVFRYQVLYQLF